MDPIYVWVEPDTFTEHRTVDAGNTTVCGLRYEDFPDYPGTPEGEHDKPWFSDHERDDVAPCRAGCL